MGFDKVSPGFKRMDEDLYLDQVNRLSELTTKFEPIPQGMSFELGSMKPVAFVENKTNGEQTTLKLNSKYYVGTTPDKMERHETETSIINGKEYTYQYFSMPCSEEYLDRYTITHEYGHILENSLIFTDEYKEGFNNIMTDQNISVFDKPYEMKKYYRDNAEKVEDQFRREIIDIAKETDPDFKVADYISRYGQTNSAEFFAECFANSQCGEPNKLGDAMTEWLRRRGYDI